MAWQDLNPQYPGTSLGYHSNGHAHPCQPLWPAPRGLFLSSASSVACLQNKHTKTPPLCPEIFHGIQGRSQKVDYSSRFGFLPAGLCGTAGNLLALLLSKLLGSSFTTLLAAKLAEFDRSGVLAVRLTLWQFGVTRGHVHDKLGELVDVSRAFAFGHDQ
jgi:hypothetical protein